MAGYGPFTYNGLTFGDGTDFEVTRVDGLAPPDRREESSDNPVGDGAFVFAQHSGARRIVFEGEIWGTLGPDLATKERSFRAAFGNGLASPVALTFPTPAGDTWRTLCLPRRSHFPIDELYHRGMAIWAVELVAPDPRLYSDTLQSVTLSPGSEGGVDFGGPGQGLDFGGAGQGIDFGGGGAAELAIINAGTTATLPTVRFIGPATNPRIRNMTTGLELKLLGTIEAGDWIDLDFAARTILLNGSASRYGMLDVATSSWWAIAVGSNTLQFQASVSSGATQALLTWRDAWL